MLSVRRTDALPLALSQLSWHSWELAITYTVPLSHSTLHVHTEYNTTVSCFLESVVDMSDKRSANNFINTQGRSVAQTPGGYKSMGFYPVGPKAPSTASFAQSYQGNVPKGSTFSSIQSGSMKGGKKWLSGKESYVEFF